METKELPTRYLISIITISVFLGVFIGHIIKSCPECEKCVYTPPNEVSERVEDAVVKAKEEIKHEANETIKEIYSATPTELDSLWRDFAIRYGKDKP